MDSVYINYHEQPHHTTHNLLIQVSSTKYGQTTVKARFSVPRLFISALNNRAGDNDHTNYDLVIIINSDAPGVELRLINARILIVRMNYFPKRYGYVSVGNFARNLVGGLI